MEKRPYRHVYARSEWPATVIVAVIVKTLYETRAGETSVMPLCSSGAGHPFSNMKQDET